MKIAYITYEYPPDIAQGGIATYVGQVAKLMQMRGHIVEIFCGSHHRTISEYSAEGIYIHRCQCNDPIDFRKNIVKIFEERHNAIQFNVMESPEINGNAYDIKLKFPSVPLAVKLHMAAFVQMRLFNFYTPWYIKARFFLGGLRRGKIKFYGTYHKEDDIDFKLTKLAEGISSPSRSLREIISEEWNIPLGKIALIPHPFIPSNNLLSIPIRENTSKTVTFAGKLNVHKGLVSLVETIPKVVKAHPSVMFTLIGNDSYFTVKQMNMSDYIKQELKGYEKNYQLMGGIAYEEVLMCYAETAVCVYPSIWENFPLVCLEAMSAGRAVVGSRNGGMSEMLADDAGLIIDPLNADEIADAICHLLDDAALRYKLGNNARKKVTDFFSGDSIPLMIEQHLQEAIDRSKLVKN